YSIDRIQSLAADWEMTPKARHLTVPAKRMSREAAHTLWLRYPGSSHEFSKCRAKSRGCRSSEHFSGGFRLAFRFLEVPAELESHGGQKFIGEIGFASRAEPLVKRGRKNVSRHSFINGGFDSPAPFA